MEKAQKPNISECDTPLSEPFRINYDRTLHNQCCEDFNSYLNRVLSYSHSVSYIITVLSNRSLASEGNVLSRVGVTYKMSFGLDDWIYCTVHIDNSGVQVIQRYRLSTHFAVHRYTCTRVPQSWLVVSWQSITDSLSLQITYEVFFSQPNYFLPLFCSSQFRRLNSVPLLLSWQAGVPKLNSTLSTCTAYAENTASIIKEVCLLIRCLAIGVLLLRAFACAGICLPSCCLAMGIHAIVYMK
jgi:hypothetical protein